MPAFTFARHSRDDGSDARELRVSAAHRSSRRASTPAHRTVWATIAAALAGAAMIAAGGLPALAETAPPEPAPDTATTPPVDGAGDATDGGDEVPGDGPDIGDQAPGETPGLGDEAPSDVATDDGSSGESTGDDAGLITPYLVGQPDGDGLEAPYLTWTVLDADGQPYGGTTVTLQGARTGTGNADSSWGSSAQVVDNVGQPEYQGLDLDPDPGEFAVTHVGSTRIEEGSGNTRDRYRITMSSSASAGTSWQNTRFEMAAEWFDNRRGVWNSDHGPRTHNFGVFELQVPSATITIDARVIRKESTGPSGAPGQDLNNPAFLEGLTYRLYTNVSGAPGTDTGFFCTIPAGATSCDITATGFASGAQYFVVEEPNAHTYANPILMTGDYSGPTGVFRYAGLTPQLAIGGSYEIPSNAPGQSGNSTRSAVLAASLNNPHLQQTCTPGLRIAIQMDVSASVTNAQRATYRDALHSLLDSLAGTGTEVALFNFSATNVTSHPTPLLVDTNLHTLKDRVSAMSTQGNSTTNWDHALRTVANANLTNDYDLVLFLTDGAPNVISSANGSGSTSPNGNNVTVKSVEQAIFSANAIKANGTRIAAVGIGNGVSGDVYRNLAAVSGPMQNSDYYLGDWESLKTDIANVLAQALCAVPIEVTKYELDEDAANPLTGPGWSMDIDVDSTDAVTITGLNPQATNAAGRATWSVQFTEPDATADVTISETMQTNWSFHSGTYIVHHSDGTMTTGELTGTSVALTGIVADDRIEVVFNNIPVPQDGSASWRKVDGETGDALAGSSWTLVGPGFSETIVDNTGQADYVGFDLDPAPGVFRVGDLAAGEYALTETAAPVGYELLTGTTAVTVVAGEDNPTPIDIENVRKTGTVTWGKTVTGTDDTPLGGSTWQITGPGLGPDGIVVDDFEGTAPNTAGADQDGAAGGFLVEGLAWGEYTVTEIAAPAGYALANPPASFTFTISATSLRHDQGSIGNDQVGPVTLPIAGGTGTWPYAVGGTALLLAAALAWLLIERRRRAGTNAEQVDA